MSGKEFVIDGGHKPVVWVDGECAVGEAGEPAP